MEDGRIVKDDGQIVDRRGLDCGRRRSGLDSWIVENNGQNCGRR